MFVKICGTTNLEDAQLAVELGADALGFIFAPSKRQVSGHQAASIISLLPPHVEKVGIFTEPDLERIMETVRVAGLTAVQLHLAHDRQFTSALQSLLGAKVRLLQVIVFDTALSSPAEIETHFANPLQMAMTDSALWGVLLDTARAGHSGGLGQPFPWHHAQPAIEAIRDEVAALNSTVPRLLLAGGLHAENVGDAIGALKPWGVDVVSGVEAGPGKKSPDRLAAFFTAIHSR